MRLRLSPVGSKRLRIRVLPGARDTGAAPGAGARTGRTARTRALYVPPVGWMARWADAFEQAGSRLWPGFAGVVLMEAVKQTFAVKPKAQPVRRRRAGALKPATAGPLFGPEAPARLDGQPFAPTKA